MGADLRLLLSGTWPSQCPPTPAGIRQDGLDIDIRLQTPNERCLARPRAFAMVATDELGTLPRPTLPGVHRIRVELVNPDGSLRLLGFQLLRVGPPVDTTPESGAWWGELGGRFGANMPGVGIVLDAQGQTLGATILGYAADGAPEWIFGAGKLGAGIAELEMVRLSGGSGPFGTHQPPADARTRGTLLVELLSPTRATLWWLTTDTAGHLQLEALSIVRMQFGQAPTEAWVGRWHVSQVNDPKDTGWTVRLTRGSSSGDALHFEALGGGSLRCSLDPRRPDSPPDTCTLFDGRGTPVGQFNEISTQRMVGETPEGTRIQAVHLDP